MWAVFQAPAGSAGPVSSYHSLVMEKPEDNGTLVPECRHCGSDLRLHSLLVETSPKQGRKGVLGGKCVCSPEQDRDTKGASEGKDLRVDSGAG